jgi:hypothetical protein
MKSLRFLLLIFVLFSLATLSAREADSLYNRLHKKAVANLKNMPSAARKDYIKLLKSHTDRVMAFILAYEENGRLAAANPQVVQNHWRSVTEMMQEQGITQPDEFFLSYVAKITVSDEAITDYRRQFESGGIYDKDNMFDGLKLKELRQKITDPLELYRQMCLVSTELLMYKPTSGRDQSPMDVAARSLVGRCEESQILFVALCRTVGIPARAASTPWWAHQDDNHAWAEVFLDGRWQYSGDSDGGYWPNQTWFTGLTKKMVIIAADGTLPAPTDEVLGQDDYSAVINSIRYYAGENVRTLKLKVVDGEGKPVPKCFLGIDVYNFYSLRPQAFTRTDENGEKTITVGQGAFFIMTFKDTLNTLQYVPSGTESELEYIITLNKAELPEITAMMEYPNYRPDFLDAPQEWKDSVTEAKNNRQKRLDDIADLMNPSTFARIAQMDDPDFVLYMRSLVGDEPNYLARQLIGLRSYLKQFPAVDESDSLFFQLLTKMRLNPDRFLGFDMVRKLIADNRLRNNHEMYQTWISTLLQNDEKDLWQADGWTFYRMYKWFEYAYPKVNSLPKEEMLNLFEPTIFYENLPWQTQYYYEKHLLQGLYPKRMILSKPAKPTPQQVIKLFRKNHRIKPEKAMTGLIPLDIGLFTKNLTGYQYKILACAYLRANLIPANYTRIPNVVAVYTDGSWKYFDLSKNDYFETEKRDDEAVNKVTFSLTDEQDLPVSLKPEQIQVCFIRDGQFFSVSGQTEYKGNGVFEASVPEKGRYYAQIGYRSSDSLTVYMLKPLSKDGKTVTDLDVKITQYHRKWQPAEAFFQNIASQVEQIGYDCFVLGNYSQENSIRISNKLKSEGKRFLLVGYETGKPEGIEYATLPEFLEMIREVPSLQNRTITLIKNAGEGSWQMYEGLWDKLP